MIFLGLFPYHSGKRDDTLHPTTPWHTTRRALSTRICPTWPASNQIHKVSAKTLGKSRDSSSGSFTTLDSLDHHRQITSKALPTSQFWIEPPFLPAPFAHLPLSLAAAAAIRCYHCHYQKGIWAVWAWLSLIFPPQLTVCHSCREIAVSSPYHSRHLHAQCRSYR